MRNSFTTEVSKDLDGSHPFRITSISVGVIHGNIEKYMGKPKREEFSEGTEGDENHRKAVAIYDFQNETMKLKVPSDPRIVIKPGIVLRVEIQEGVPSLTRLNNLQEPKR